MRRTRSVVLFSVAAPLILMQLLASGCSISGLTGTDGGTGTASGFNLAPQVVLTVDVQRGVAPLNVHFSSSGSADDGVIVRRQWDFGDGASSEEISPSHTFVATGEYTTTLTLTDNQGASASRGVVIAVTEQPIAVIEVDRTSAPTAPATFNFDGSGIVCAG